jgi:hypothetical protein
MNRREQPAGEFLEGDAMPETLDPLLDSALGEMLPYLEAVLKVALPALQSPPTLPRFMDNIEFPMAGGRYQRPAMPYGLWMLQRALDAVRAMPPADVAAVRDWLARRGAERLLDVRMPRVRRAGLRVALESSPPQPTGNAATHRLRAAMNVLPPNRASPTCPTIRSRRANIR